MNMPKDKWFLLAMDLLVLAFCLLSPAEANLSVEKFEENLDYVVFDRVSTENGAEYVPDAHLINKRDTLENHNFTAKSNITSYVTKLNTSHQQLLVHWTGLGSQTLICLAKNNQPLLGYKQNPTPSALYISYDYGKTFENKTQFFLIEKDHYASVDKFFFHKKDKRYIIFTDKFNRRLFLTKDYGHHFTMVNLTFEPTEVLTHPHDPWLFLVYDSNQKLRVTRDFGSTFEILQEMVKTYFWSNVYLPGKSWPSVNLVCLRSVGPTYAAAISISSVESPNKWQVKSEITDVEQITNNGDFVFATRKVNETSKLLFISYRGGDFRNTTFDTNLPMKSFHVVDTSESRLMVVVSLTETLANLYISELEENQEKYLFRLSLERIFCFVPNIMWPNSWLSDVAEGAFADIHKVQGMRGIYLASQVVEDAQGKTISPEHLTSVITYDWGGEWRPLEPPKFDIYGKPNNITEMKAKNISLHVTQKFNSLYPVTRNVPILTSRSAPGIIIATGTVGPSLKGHVGVYVSRDAGLSWNHVLRENYLFNMGDHGGIFTAVKLFKSVGETFEVLYSFDEGESWDSFKFADKPMRIYGLMTEPGENTTVFTIFGSEPERHEWTIINIDFQKAFPVTCSMDDYKMWSPSSNEPRIKMSCVMGMKETYERRIRHTKCFSGVDYDRPIKMEPCYCDFEDFECDYGFLRHVSSPDCIRNKTDTSDPYKIQSDCKPGHFYRRTKGYRKIDGDACIGGFEDNYLPDLLPCPLKEPNQFLLLAQKDHIVRFDLLDQQPITLPINNLHNVIAIDYDIKNNCVYFADIVTDVIGRQCFTGKKEVERLVDSHMRSVEGIAFDWISNLLYFVDGIRATIEVIRTDIDHYGRMRTTILDNRNIKKPRGIALHPVRGYMFWTDWDEKNPSVNRANLDGSNIKVIKSRPDVHWPNGITVDHISEHIYWVDANLDYIATADLEGRHFRKILSSETEKRMLHPFSVAVFKDTMYWDDWTEDAIFMADKDHGSGVQPFAILYPGLMDVKVYGHGSQTGNNSCASANQKCSHLCLALPDNKYKCACPDGMIEHRGECVCENNHAKPLTNGTCPKYRNATCASGQFSCANGYCIPKAWQCDKDDDCGDNSDELNCHQPCGAAFFDCGQGKCIPFTWRCDQEVDCPDGRDEMKDGKDCPAPVCEGDKFQCKNNRCINKKWVCDGENDCRDGSDEANCTTPLPHWDTNCTGSQFQCKVTSSVHCIPRVWVCDGETDCMDFSDEKNCDANSCDPYIQFKCEKTHRCILKTYMCDGTSDCGPDDDSDERNCTTIVSTTPPTSAQNNVCKGWMFRCNNQVCIPSWWKCDGVNDCGDNSDEEGCLRPPKSKITTTTESPNDSAEGQCGVLEFRCDDGSCIAESWVCDGGMDCDNGEDEKHCEPDAARNNSCPSRFFKCKKSRVCVADHQVCDGNKQCPDGSDEKDCNEHSGGPVNPACAPGFFACDGSLCLPLVKYCNNVSDCYDGTDESNCSYDPRSRVYQITHFGVDKYKITAHSLLVSWWVADAIASKVSLQYLPSIAEVLDDSKPQVWKNASWSTEMKHTFDNLIPFTMHNVTVYVKLLKKFKNETDKVFPPGMYLTATTAADVPSAPLDVKVAQLRDNLVQVAWSPPRKPNGNISHYEIFIKPPLPPMEVDIDPLFTQANVSGFFMHDQTYSVWVQAVNQVGYTPSDIATFTADNASTISSVANFVVSGINDTAISWMWDSVHEAQGYKLDVSAAYPYAHLPSVTTSETHYSFTNLAPGVDYTFFIRAYRKQFEGPKTAKGGRTSGNELPVVPGLAATLAVGASEYESSVLFQWNPPKHTGYKAKWVFGIYYSTSSTDFFQAPKNTTSNLNLLVNGLGACEKYMVDIGLVGPYGAGPLSAAPLTITTGNDPRAPPKKLHVVADRHNDTLVDIKWSSSCFNMSESVGYVLTIHDDVINKLTSITFLPTNKTEMIHRLQVHFGGRYTLRVQTDREGARSSEPVTYVAPHLPTPHQIEAHAHKDDASQISVYWNLAHEKSIILPPYKYEVLVSEGKPLVESDAKVMIAESPPFAFKEAKTGTVYYFAVRLVTEKGYKSAISEITAEELPMGPWANVMSPTTVIGIFVPALLVLVMVIGAFAIFIIRHRRLQNNFTSFTNSHYSTRSGAATFTTDGLDDEDSPVIRGFSDDEPLVVA